MSAGGGMSIEMWLAEDDQVAVQSELQRKVFDEMTWEPSLDASEINVVVEDRAVTLSGRVKSYPERLAAERATRRVHGVREVRNEVAVELPESQQRNDRQLARTVAWAIESDAEVPHAKIEATVTCGWVDLAGEVAGAHERHSIEDAVQRLVGVKGINNLITIKPALGAEDPRGRVEAALRRSPGLHGDHIKVEVAGTTVMLHGRVHCLAERDQAVEAAWAAPGITAVREELEVGR